VGVDEGFPDRSPFSFKHILSENILHTIITFLP